MKILVRILIILLLYVTPVFAGDNAPAFTDEDLKKYKGSTTSEQGTPGTSVQTRDKKVGRSVSPLESDLRRRKDEVIQENRDYIENQYRWMKTDCEKYEGELRKDCLFGTEEWYKDQLRQLKDLKEYLSK